MNREMLEEHSASRQILIPSMAVYGLATFAVDLMFLVSAKALFDGNGGASLPAIILGILGFAVTFELIAAIRDFRTQPKMLEGEAGRIWKKSKVLFFGRQDYLLVNGKVFEVSPITATELQPGQRVAICHWPHTSRVITLQRIVDS